MRFRQWQPRVGERFMSRAGVGFSVRQFTGYHYELNPTGVCRTLSEMREIYDYTIPPEKEPLTGLVSPGALKRFREFLERNYPGMTTKNATPR